MSDGRKAMMLNPLDVGTGSADRATLDNTEPTEIKEVSSNDSKRGLRTPKTRALSGQETVEREMENRKGQEKALANTQVSA